MSRTHFKFKKNTNKYWSYFVAPHSSAGEQLSTTPSAPNEV